MKLEYSSSRNLNSLCLKEKGYAKFLVVFCSSTMPLDGFQAQYTLRMEIAGFLKPLFWVNVLPRTWVTSHLHLLQTCVIAVTFMRIFFIYASKIAFCFELLLSWEDSKQQSILLASHGIFAHERFNSKVLFGFEFGTKKKIQFISSFWYFVRLKLQPFSPQKREWYSLHECIFKEPNILELLWSYATKILVDKKVHTGWDISFQTLEMSCLW